MRIRFKYNRNMLYTIVMLICCIYYFTYKFWDVRTVGIKYMVLALLCIGIFAYFINLTRTKKTGFGYNRFFFMYMGLEIVFLICAICAASNEQCLLALYQYNFYTLVLLGCLVFSSKTDFRVVFNVLRIVGCILTLFSIYEIVTRVYLVPVDEWYGKVNYSGRWFLRAKVFTGSPMVYGLMMTIIALIAFDYYHKNRGIIDFLIFIINLIGVLTSLSRGPYVALAVSLIVYLFFDEKTKIAKYIFSGFALLLILVLIIEIGSRSNSFLALLKARIFSIFQWGDTAPWSSNSSRLSLWISTIRIVFDGHNWITGIGAASTGARTIATGGFVTESGVLRRIVEFGFPIAIIYYCFLIGIIRTGYRNSKRRGNEFALLELSVVICILVEDIALQITEEISITFLLWMFIASMLTFRNVSYREVFSSSKNI